MSSPHILVVDDDADHLRVVCDQLEHAGYDVTGVESASDALSSMAEVDPQIVISDLRMPGMDGLQLLEKIRSDSEGVDVMVMTGHEDMTSAVAAMKGGAFDYLVKPIRLEELKERVETCLEERKLRARLEAQEEEEESESSPLLVGRDPRMIEIYKTIGVLARNRATVLIRGETGTGKEMIARAIHQSSAHADEPFLPVNCTALSDTLLESELFGHVRGAFTGAVSGRKGYFEMAGSGTIFLDEIGDTTSDFQTKLLRVLQERTFYPVGGEHQRKTDARVVAATHRPMEQLVRDGKFRQDLYFRLKVVEIDVPPLRQRKGDVPLLAEHLLERVRAELHQDVRYISEAAMEKLVSYDWPGNVRELEHALTRAAIATRSGVIGPEHLSLGPDGEGKERGSVKAMSEDELRLDRVVARHVRAVLDRTGGDRSEAAHLLGVEPERLDDLLEEDEIESAGSV